MALDEKAFNKLFFSTYIGAALSKQRERMGITIVEISEKVGVKHPYVANILNGKAVGNTQIFEKIAMVLHMNRDQFENLVQEAKAAEFQHTHGKNIASLIPADLAVSLRSNGIADEEVINDILRYVEWRKTQKEEQKSPKKK